MPFEISTVGLPGEIKEVPEIVKTTLVKHKLESKLMTSTRDLFLSLNANTVLTISDVDNGYSLGLQSANRERIYGRVIHHSLYTEDSARDTPMHRMVKTEDTYVSLDDTETGYCVANLYKDATSVEVYGKTLGKDRVLDYRFMPGQTDTLMDVKEVTKKADYYKKAQPVASKKTI